MVALGLLVSLVLLAAVLWSAPMRREKALARASLTSLEEMARANPEDGRVQYHRGRLLRETGKQAEARDAFARAAALSGNDEASWLAWAELTGALYGPGEGAKIVAGYARTHPGSAVAQRTLARLLLQGNAHGPAYDAALTAVRLAPADPEMHTVLGEAAEKAGKRSEAETAFREAIRLSPNDARRYVRLADLLAAQKRYRDALPALREAARLSPDDPEMDFLLGQALLQAGTTDTEFAEARKYLEASQARRPDVPRTLLLIGQTWMRQGRWAEARAAFEKLERLPLLLVDSDMRQTAAYQAALACRRLGDTTGTARALAVHRRIQEYRIQKKDARKRVAESPRDVSRWLGLARLCAGNGDAADAVQAYRQALALSPELPAAWQGLAALERATIEQANASNVGRGESKP
jgi:cytochrome c-type biogenesis protein CcmH/NrfG